MLQTRVYDELRIPCNGANYKAVFTRASIECNLCITSVGRADYEIGLGELTRADLCVAPVRSPRTFRVTTSLCQVHCSAIRHARVDVNLVCNIHVKETLSVYVCNRRSSDTKNAVWRHAGLASFFRASSLEERSHAQMLMNFQVWQALLCLHCVVCKHRLLLGL